MMKQETYPGQFITILDQSMIAYRQYFHAGKTFHFARELKKYNAGALNWLVENKRSLPEGLQEYAEALVTHYKEWSAKWEKLASEKEFQPNDVFAFENEITFPKEAAKKLEEAFRQPNDSGDNNSLR